MRVEISYEEALSKYPRAVEEAVRDLGKSRSKKKDTPAEDMEWEFMVGEQIKGAMGFEDFLSQVENGPERREEVSLDDVEVLASAKAEERYDRSHIVLVCKPGGNARGTSEPLHERVSEVFERYMEGELRSFREQARIDALSDEEREREVEENLRQLSGQPGFMAVSVTPREKSKNKRSR